MISVNSRVLPNPTVPFPSPVDPSKTHDLNVCFSLVNCLCRHWTGILKRFGIGGSSLRPDKNVLCKNDKGSKLFHYVNRGKIFN